MSAQSVEAFKKKLYSKEDGYAGITGARRGIGRFPDLTSKEHAEMHALANEHFGVEEETETKKAAPKKSPVKAAPKAAPKKSPAKAAAKKEPAAPVIPDVIPAVEEEAPKKMRKRSEASVATADTFDAAARRGQVQGANLDVMIRAADTIKSMPEHIIDIKTSLEVVMRKIAEQVDAINVLDDKVSNAKIVPVASAPLSAPTPAALNGLGAHT